MSFTKNLKAQLSKIDNSCRFCDVAELAAIIRLSTNYSREDITVSTENEDVAERIGVLFEKVFAKKLSYVNRNGSFRFVIDEEFFVGEFANKLLLFESDSESLTPKPCCSGAYIRGAFLGGGSMPDPKKRYHMEFDTKYEGYAIRLKEALLAVGVSAKITERKGGYAVYLKEYEAIADTLGAMGAVGAAMELYNISIEKEIRNAANRRANCEIANIDKITKAASLQIDAIKKIEKHPIFLELPETLREIADVRKEYPEESLQELGKRLNPPIGKSGVNHRLKRIEEIAKNL